MNTLYIFQLIFSYSKVPGRNASTNHSDGGWLYTGVWVDERGEERVLECISHELYAQLSGTNLPISSSVLFFSDHSPVPLHSHMFQCPFLHALPLLSSPLLLHLHSSPFLPLLFCHFLFFVRIQILPARV